MLRIQCLLVKSWKMSVLVKLVVILGSALAASSFNLGSTDVVFHLFTRSNPSLSQALFPTAASIMSSSFSPSKPTIITIHNNGEPVAGNFNAFVVPAHLAVVDVNVIAVDWSVASNMYTVGLANSPQVGRIVAQFMNILVQSFGYDVNLFRIVGIGLGGHIAGIAARNCVATVPHIIALDPSFHGWHHHPERLNISDASIVEVLHTTSGLMGYDQPIGYIDFYPNGGSYQNGCGLDTSCSHIYAYAFYAESINQSVMGGNAFIGTECDSYQQATNLNCHEHNRVIFGGIETKTPFDTAPGIYSFTTNAFPPFARGETKQITQKQNELEGVWKLKDRVMRLFV